MKKFWSPAEKSLLIELYPKTCNAKLCVLFECSVRSIYNAANNLGVKKDKDFLLKQNQDLVKKLNEAGKTYRYKKGNVPANKGKKQSEYMSPESIEKTKKTRFKKGNTPKNFKDVGSTRVNVDGYIEIKTKNPNKWELLHRVVWKKHNGSIPKNMNIQFKDKNSQNCNIDNLYIISRSDQMKNENSFHAKYPEPIKKIIHAKAVLTRQINKSKKSLTINN